MDEFEDDEVMIITLPVPDLHVTLAKSQHRL
jgi:hypothetical protein